MNPHNTTYITVHTLQYLQSITVHYTTCIAVHTLQYFQYITVHCTTTTSHYMYYSTCFTVHTIHYIYCTPLNRITPNVLQYMHYIHYIHNTACMTVQALYIHFSRYSTLHYITQQHMTYKFNAETVLAIDEFSS